MQVAERPEKTIRADFWSRPISNVVPISGEVLVYVAIFVVAALLRLTDLGSRMLHHDESLHATYSWYYYIGRGYMHDPMMHGPWQFTIMALTYVLLGASDATARVPHAVFGAVLAILPFFIRQHLGRAGAIAASVLLTLSPSFLYFTRFAREDAFAVTWTMVMVVATLRYLSRKSPGMLYLLAAGASLFFCTKENSYIFVGIITSFLLLHSLLTDRSDVLRGLTSPPARLPQSDLAILLATLALPLFAGFAYLPLHVLGVEPVLSDAIVVATLVVLVAISAFVGTSWDRVLWPRAAGVFWGIFVVLHTSFFSNPNGLYSGAIGALKYWVEQQGVARGGQPWFYYLVLLPIYEFVPIIFGVAGMVVWGRAFLAGRRQVAPALFVWWVALGMVIYGYTSEKMPWLAVHLTLPFLLLAGMTIGKLVESVRWAEAIRDGAIPYAIALSLALVGFFSVIGREAPFLRPLETVAAQQALFQWIGLIAVTLGLVWLASKYASRLGGRTDLKVAAVTLLAGLMLLSVRTAWQVSYYNGDVPVEMLVYTQTTRDVGKVMRTIEATAFRTGTTPETFKVAYDSGVSWPFEWYLRDYKSRVFYGNGLPPADAPIVLVSFENGNDIRVKSALGNRYVGQRYRLRAWFDEAPYRGLTLGVIWRDIVNPADRQRVWRFLMYREQLGQSGSTDFMMYVRRDLAIGPWSATQAPAQTVDDDIYTQRQRNLTAVQQIGVKGFAAGQLADPRGIAIGPDGSIYVTEATTHRVSRFDANGQFLGAWGQKGSAEGQFNEPWGIGVGKDGAVYVADTWNHRIQVFGADGTYVATWGQGAQLYGPRSIAVTDDGRVLVADSGNHRILAFDKTGQVVAQVGGRGAGEGQFAEPVGIALDRSGNAYVADTWNRRIQKLDSTLRPAGAWAVALWEGESIVNKPYVAADADGNIYATDPETSRVVKFGPTGAVLAVWGKPGTDLSSMQLPIGIAADSAGSIYVADSLNGRILKFAAVK